jgi:hypothetical protein
MKLTLLTIALAVGAKPGGTGRGRLYLCTLDGHVLCLAGTNETGSSK